MTDFQFPSGFFWGAATSSHQVEGDNRLNDWWAWERAGRVKEASGPACDHYRRFRQDFDLARQLGHNAHRFSIEWSRIEPEEGVVNDEALRHYRDVVDALRERGIEPIVTLHHYTNPTWLAKHGGWAKPKVVDAFARYTRWVVKALGDRVRYWLTINEPMVYAVMHYLDGVGPPGMRHAGFGFRVMEHLVRAHAQSYHIIHDSAPAGRQPMVSIAMHLQPFTPCRPGWVGDRWISHLTEQTYNFRFPEALMTGLWKLPAQRAVRIPEAANTLDYLGVNYYSRIFMRLGYSGWTQWWGQRCDTSHHPEVVERNMMGWDVYPPGIAQIIEWMRPYQRPIMVTENGICAAEDPQRERFIVRHLQQVARSMQQGAPIIGYFYWSLLDNFEWAHGYGPRFGLIEVDYATQARRIRPSAERLAQICRSNRITLDADPAGSPGGARPA